MASEPDSSNSTCQSVFVGSANQAAIPASSPTTAHGGSCARSASRKRSAPSKAAFGQALQ